MSNDNIIKADPKSNLNFAWWLNLIIIFVVAAILISSNWSTIRGSSIEVGDFAANSLLIQDAKSLELLVGNYSRVGFNHPGPAILYVLAAGEILFHDAFNLGISPIGGQLIAVGIYSACWLVVILALFVRFIGQKSLALLGLAIFLYATSWADFQFLTGMWFPHLYYLPFVVFLLAASRLANGHADSWGALAASSGFLINGHVSFVAVLSIILIFAIVFNHIQSRANKSITLLSKSFFCSNKREVAYFFGIIFIFVSPLIIESILRFPGPLADYVAFGSHHKPNGLVETLSFVSQYWGGGLPMLTGMTMLLALVGGVKNEAPDFFKSIRSLVVLLFSATFAFWFYARYGIDYLDQKYIGLFYYSVPVLAFVAAAVVVFRQIFVPFKGVGLIFLGALLAFGAYGRIDGPASYAGQYAAPKIAELYQSLNRVERSGRLVFDLTGGEHWAEIWSKTLGLLSYAKRQNNNFICINKNWHISFTRENKCTPDEVAQGRRIVVRSVSSEKRFTEKQILKIDDLSFYSFSLPQVAGKGYISISRYPDLFDNYFLASGWSAAEKDFVWSDGPKAQLQIPVGSEFTGELKLDIAAYLPVLNSTQKIEVQINGIKQQPILFDANKNRQEITFKINRALGEPLTIDFYFDKPLSPSNYRSGDNRNLGVSLYGFEIR